MTPRWNDIALGLGIVALVAGGWRSAQSMPQSSESLTPNPVPMETVIMPPGADSLTDGLVAPDVVAAQTAFGLALLRDLYQEAPQDNLLISPLSVAMALTMAYNGAAGDTQAAMAEVLRLQGLDLDPINQGNQALMERLATTAPGLDIAIANGLWMNQNLPVYPSFVAAMTQHYGAEVAAVDFADAAIPSQINRWVSDQTRGHIPTLVDQIDPNQLLLLVNALYFKGDWTTAFDPALTTDQPFTLADGTAIQHPAMERRGSFNYFATDQWQAVSLPYGPEETLSFEIILPAEDVPLSEVVAQLTPEAWATWMGQGRRRDGLVQIPRFTTAYEADLIPALTRLGMGVAFTDAADFSGLTSLSAAINQVRHKTTLEVTESGAEASAATVIGIMPTSIMVDPEPPFALRVDRPFLVALRDRPTGVLLFVGTIADPR
ncbi:proteinase inhibitor I4 serpin [Leptolyngbya sp. BL0902]|uniref:serpin family protein n=1 Tax=Leptolyngbya sp. BL0902 TaxID=1115757 RepID=UPI0018E79DA4|nr:serpin family protein [Leptolyngbya sp. BL0902]QQE64593.1 proteinase inhibitor I4 serpin [Leptolyngbya sp. BL0902]